MLTILGMHTSSSYSQPSGSSYGSQHQPVHDNTGQVQPPGKQTRVTATLWEDEGTICFQVECNGLCVARREGKSELTACAGSACMHDLPV